MNEIREDQRIAYLRRLLKVYCLFLTHYSNVDVSLVKIKGKKVIQVRYDTPKPNVHTQYQFQIIEFPIEHLTKRVNHYKNKVKTAFKNRNK